MPDGCGTDGGAARAAPDHAHAAAEPTSDARRPARAARDDGARKQTEPTGFRDGNTKGSASENRNGYILENIYPMIIFLRNQNSKY